MSFDDTCDVLNSLGLLTMDAKCYRELCVHLLKVNESMPQYTLKGVSTGYSSFMFPLFTLDMSIVVHAGLQILARATPIAEILVDFPYDYYERLKLIRNNMHLYNKYGTYKTKAQRIIANQQKEYRTDIRDDLYKYRNDISLAYKVDGEKEHLLGSELTIHHIYDTEKFSWEGNDFLQYSQNTATLINTLSNNTFVSLPEISLDVFANRTIHVELFDQKIDVIFSKFSSEKTIPFRLLLILSQISYSNTFYDQCINEQFLPKHPEWFIFFLKWFAIHYDEAFDSIENMTRYSKYGDKENITNILNEFTNFANHSKYRTIAQKFRNTVHYSGNNSRLYLDDKGSFEINFFKLYAEKTNILTWVELEDSFVGIRNELLILEQRLRELFQEL